jgi:peptidoglycan/LPS O-acetylase OafA/YrhL
LEGLRAFAALGVVTLHTTYLIGHALFNEYTYPWLASFWVFGNTGVQLFFVLSGFLLFLPYARAMLFQERWPKTRTFYMRRALRILPGYYFSLLLLVFFVQRTYLLPSHWPQLFLFLTFFMESSSATFRQINVPYWSLGTEVQFYLLLPFVALGMYALVKRVAHSPEKRLLAALLTCAALIVIGLAVRYVGLHVLPGETGFPGVLLSIGQFFLFGVTGKYWEDFAIGMAVSLCFVYAQHPERGQSLRERVRRLSWLSGLAALVVLTFCAFWNFRTSYPTPQLDFLLPFVPYRAWLLDFVVALGWGLLIATIVFGNPLFKAPFETRLMRSLGTISYAIYLWHFPLLSIFRKYIFAHLAVTSVPLSFLLYGSFFALVVLPWCAGVYYFVERPFMLLKDRRPPGQKRVETAPPPGVQEKDLLVASPEKTA